MVLRKLQALGVVTFGVLAGGASAQFNAAVDHTIQFAPQAVAAGDFDQDGDKDLAVTAETPDRVVILLNNGDGTFTHGDEFNLAKNANPWGIASADFDGDGHHDLAVTMENLDQVQILWGEGDGAFSLGGRIDVGDAPTWIVAFQGDGSTGRDLAVVNAASDNVSILINDGDGSFTMNFDPAGDEPRQIAYGDLDDDGDDDLALASAGTNEVVVRTADGTGGFAGGFTLSTGTIVPTGVAIGDFDDDGDNDIAVAGDDDSSQHVVLVFEHITPAGTFGGPVTYSTNASDPTAMASGDFDLDGDVDLAVTHETSNDVSILLNNGDGTFSSTPILVGVDALPRSLIAVDLDDNDSLDLVTANEAGDSVSVLMNVNASAFFNIGFGLGGTEGIPELVGTGTLQPGAVTQLEVTDAPLNASGFLFIGLDRLDAPFAGGTLVPTLDFIIPVTTDAEGNLELTGTWPTGVPSGEDFYFQLWFVDSGAPRNLAASNAVCAIAP